MGSVWKYEWKAIKIIVDYLSLPLHLQRNTAAEGKAQAFLPFTERLQDSQDRWPIRLGWLKRELNLMPHFLSEMRQALWLDLSQKDLFRSTAETL